MDISKLKAPRRIYSPPIEKDLGDNGGPVRFDSAEEFIEWIENEVEVWSGVFSSNKNGEMRPFLNEVIKRNIDGILSGVSPEAGPLSEPYNVVKILDGISKGGVVISRSKLGLYVIDLSKSRPDLAGIVIAVKKFPGIIDGFSSIKTRLILEASSSLVMADSYFSDIDFAKSESYRRLDDINSVLNDVRRSFRDVEVVAERLERADAVSADIRSKLEAFSRDLDEKLSEAREDIRLLSNEFSNSLSDSQASLQERIAGMEAALETRVNIKASEKLWRSKRASHAIWCTVSGLLLFLGLFLGSLSALWYGFDYLEMLGLIAVNSVDAADGDAATKVGAAKVASSEFARIGLAVLPIVAVVWFLRVNARIFFSNLNQLGDAAERIAMIHTFLSFEKEGRASDERDRILMLQALFRPGPGMASDDAMPPNWFDLLMQRIEPSKPK